MVDDVLVGKGGLVVFRRYAGVQLAFLAVACLSFSSVGAEAPHPVGPVGWMTLAAGALLGFLFWPGRARAAEGGGLTWAVLLATAIPFVGQTAALDEPLAVYTRLASEASVLLVVPLLVVSWHSGFRVVLAFSVGTAVVDAALLGLVVDGAAPAQSAYLRTLALRTLAFVGIGGVVSRLSAELRDQIARLARANLELADHAVTRERLAVSRERGRLAHELHDTLAHTLSAAAVQLEGVKALWSSDRDEAKALLCRALRIVREGLGETRRALKALPAEPVEELGVCRAVGVLAEEAAARSGWRLSLDVDGEPEEVPTSVAHHVYRIAQEALTNVARHADARHVRVSCAVRGRNVSLSIVDDGRGFASESVDEDGHRGLSGMRSRARDAGGHLEVTSAPGEGTAVTFSGERGA